MLLFVVAILACILTGLWLYARWNFGVLEKMGIPVVEYSNPLLGSTRDLYTKAGGLLDLEWMRKYGPVFGVYQGRQAQVFFCTPELVRLVCVKDAEYFNSKGELDIGNPILNEMPDFAPLEKWRLLRSLTTPAFTSAKMKLLNLPMREATQDFVADLKRKIKASGKGHHEKLPVDIREFLSLHTMLIDLIARCVFSIKITDGSNDENNEFIKLMTHLITPAPRLLNKELIIWGHAFPFVKKLLLSSTFNPEPVNQFVQLFKQMMAERKRNNRKTNDFMEMVVEWWSKLDTPEFKHAKITELALISQLLVFFFASQDQISTMVAGVIYHMTQDPKLERRIYEELDTVFAKHKGRIEHDQLNELVLLNSVINECLRLYSFFHRTERVCTKDWENKEYNLKIKKGTLIIIPLMAINRSSEYNENANQFDAERFMPENKDKLNIFSSTSFGHGPRNCTGQRFATEAMPLILAYLLKELRFVDRKDTEMKLLPGSPFYTPHSPIYVDVEERLSKKGQ